MSMNEYINRFTQLSRYARHKVDTDEKKREYFLNGLNDGLPYPLEARDFENFQGMVNKALVLENCRGLMEHKHKLVCQHQLAVAPGRILLRLQLDMCSVLLSHYFNRSGMQLDKDFPPCSVK
jgi:hypothetical protein